MKKKVVSEKSKNPFSGVAVFNCATLCYCCGLDAKESKSLIQKRRRISSLHTLN